MPPKKPAQEVVQQDLAPAADDPAAVLAREIRERQCQEERRAFEKNEMMARRTVEAMEQVSWKCVYYEKEKRLDPAAWANKTAVVSPQYVVVKRLVGNRAIPQQIAKIPVTDQMTVGQLKIAVQQEFVKLQIAINVAVTASATFAPEKQRLFTNGSEIKSSSADDLVKNVGIHSMSTVHVAFAAPTNLSNLHPSMIN